MVEAGGAAELSLLQRIRSDDSSDDRLRAAVISQAYDRVWERLHCGSWKTVSHIWRQAFAYASVLKALHLFKQEQFVESLRILDMVTSSNQRLMSIQATETAGLLGVNDGRALRHASYSHSGRCS